MEAAHTSETSVDIPEDDSELQISFFLQFSLFFLGSLALLTKGPYFKPVLQHLTNCNAVKILSTELLCLSDSCFLWMEH
jgi:hypothetical protein